MTSDAQEVLEELGNILKEVLSKKLVHTEEVVIHMQHDTRVSAVINKLVQSYIPWLNKHPIYWRQDGGVVWDGWGRKLDISIWTAYLCEGNYYGDIPTVRIFDNEERELFFDDQPLIRYLTKHNLSQETL